MGHKGRLCNRNGTPQLLSHSTQIRPLPSLAPGPAVGGLCPLLGRLTHFRSTEAEGVPPWGGGAALPPAQGALLLDCLPGGGRGVPGGHPSKRRGCKDRSRLRSPRHLLVQAPAPPLSPEIQWERIRPLSVSARGGLAPHILDLGTDALLPSLWRGSSRRSPPLPVPPWPCQELPWNCPAQEAGKLGGEPGRAMNPFDPPLWSSMAWGQEEPWGALTQAGSGPEGFTPDAGRSLGKKGQLRSRGQEDRAAGGAALQPSPRAEQPAPPRVQLRQPPHPPQPLGGGRPQTVALRRRESLSRRGLAGYGAGGGRAKDPPPVLVLPGRGRKGVPLGRPWAVQAPVGRHVLPGWSRWTISEAFPPSLPPGSAGLQDGLRPNYSPVSLMSTFGT